MKAYKLMSQAKKGWARAWLVNGLTFGFDVHSFTKLAELGNELFGTPICDCWGGALYAIIPHSLNFKVL